MYYTTGLYIYIIYMYIYIYIQIYRWLYSLLIVYIRNCSCHSTCSAHLILWISWKITVFWSCISTCHFDFNFFRSQFISLCREKSQSDDFTPQQQLLRWCAKYGNVKWPQYPVHHISNLFVNIPLYQVSSSCNNMNGPLVQKIVYFQQRY